MRIWIQVIICFFVVSIAAATEGVWEDPLPLNAAGRLTEDEVEAFIFDADAQNISGVWTVNDNVNFEFGTDNDFRVFYDEALDNNLIIATDSNGKLAEALIHIFVDNDTVDGTNLVNFSKVFEISKGKFAAGDHVDLFSIDNNGNAIIGGSLTLVSQLSVAAGLGYSWTATPIEGDIKVGTATEGQIKMATSAIIGMADQTISGTDLSDVFGIHVGNVDTTSNMDLIVMESAGGAGDETPIFVISEDVTGTGSWIHNTLLIGPTSTMGNVDANILCSTNYPNLDCGAGADLGVEDDLEVLGEIIAGTEGIEFKKSDDHTTCSTFSTTGGGIFYDDSEGKFKKCQDNTLTDLDSVNPGNTLS